MFSSSCAAALLDANDSNPSPKVDFIACSESQIVETYKSTASRI
jgi:hypothetical protein